MGVWRYAAFLAGTASAAFVGPSGARAAQSRGGAGAAMKASAYDFFARDLRSGDSVPLADYAGQVSLVVNVASK